MRALFFVWLLIMAGLVLSPAYHVIAKARVVSAQIGGR